MNANMTLTMDGLIGMLDIATHGSEAIERFTHYLEECGIRGEPLTMGNNPDALKAIVPNLSGELGQRAAAAIKAAEKTSESQLVKFGQSKYLKPLLEEGKLRIQPASSFSDPKHNNAVGDDEVARTFKMAINSEELLEIITKHGLPREAAGQDSLEIKIEYFSDYWVTCFGAVPTPRMAVDFAADSMLAIYDLREFRRRTRNAFRKATDYHSMKDGPVKYFDPYLPNCDFRAIPLIKPFKYYYQNEYRFFWLPTKPTVKLEFIEIEMGSIADISELITW